MNVIIRLVHALFQVNINGSKLTNILKGNKALRHFQGLVQIRLRSHSTKSLG
jgi:hypothetical protein